MVQGSIFHLFLFHRNNPIAIVLILLIIRRAAKNSTAMVSFRLMKKEEINSVVGVPKVENFYVAAIALRLFAK